MPKISIKPLVIILALSTVIAILFYLNDFDFKSSKSETAKKKLVVQKKSKSGGYYLLPSELLSKAREDKTIYRDRVRIGGIVVSKTLKDGRNTQDWEFVLTDGEERRNKQINISQTRPYNRITIKYKGLMPDTMQEGIMVLVEGSFQNNNIFQADLILAKCPAKYSEKQN